MHAQVLYFHHCGGCAGIDSPQHSLHPLSEREDSLCCLRSGDVDIVSDLFGHSVAVGLLGQGLLVVLL